MEAITSSTGTKQLYVDGALIHSCNYTDNSPSDNSPLIIGNNNTPYSTANWAHSLHVGYLDNVEIWDIALNQSEIQSYMNCSPTGSELGLIGYWDFNVGSGATVLDLSGNGNNGMKRLNG